MNDFVQVQPADATDMDWINLRNVARVHGEAVADNDWVVKVLLVTGTEIIDSRHMSREAAQMRIIEILPGDD